MSPSSIPEGPGSVSGAPNLPAGFTDTFTSRYVDAGELRLHAVIGHDTGFAISYALAADHPDRLDRVALAEIPGSPGTAPAPLNDRLVHSVVIPGTGHFVAEESPDEMLAALTPFLAPYRAGLAAAHAARPDVADTI